MAYEAMFATAERCVDAVGGEAGRGCGGAPDGTLGEAVMESSPCAGAGADGADSKAVPRLGVVSESAWGQGRSVETREAGAA
jgi:hypothetical protein